VATFAKNGTRVLEAHLGGETIKCLTGSMVAYEGNISFKNAGMGGGGGFMAAAKRKMTGESLALMEATGHGVVYLASNATEVELVQLQGDTLSVESSALLALESSLRTDVAFAGLRGATSGQGLFTTTVTGQGTCAILSDGPMIALEVSAQYPLVVDPDAFIAHRGQVRQSFVTGVSWKSLIGEDGGEPYSLRFDGTGVVYIQPAER
jgi:uncharacterized protein (AIM24 family)